jgi:hypothetical protein
MNQVHSSTRAIVCTILAFITSTCFAAIPRPTATTYSPKGGDEIEILSLVLEFEVEANRWTKTDLICFSVGQMDPSPKLVKTLRQRKLNLCSSAEWPKKFNCGFEVRMQFVSLDTSQSARVHAEVADYRDINTGQGDLALLQRAGEYTLRKIDGKWSISGYIPSK